MRIDVWLRRAIAALGVGLVLYALAARDLYAPYIDRFREPAARPCGTDIEILTTLPLALTDLRVVEPLGQVDPPNAPLPGDHLTLVPIAANPLRGSGRAVVPVLAPADGTLTALTIDESGPDPRYTVHFAPCKEVRVEIGGLLSLESTLFEDVVDNRTAEAFGRLGVRRLDLSITAGDPLGRSDTLTLSLTDTREPPLPFANPARYDPATLLGDLRPQTLKAKTAERLLPLALYAQCPIDYFKGPLQNILTSRLGAATSGIKAQREPACNSPQQDRAGTPQGNWFSDPAHLVFLDTDGALALVQDAVLPDIYRISIGRSMSQLAPGNYVFNPVRKFGFINRPFGDIEDEKIHCFENISNARTGAMEPGVFMIALNRQEKTLIADYRPGIPYCLSVPLPWSMTERAVRFWR
ncbi:MAG: hypothetical protein AAGH45_05155 [Pseudomonadota bacterium]